MHARKELVWFDVRCIGVRDCVAACPRSALELTPQGMGIDRLRCDVCGLCAEACPAAALEVIGRRWTAEELLREILKDRVFYETSGGGVTFSGGEPMMQVDFLAELLPLCRSNGLHVALDTCGAFPWERFERVLRWVDLILFDLKLMDSGRHKAATGMGNELIQENVRRLAAAGHALWIRTPIIPGHTDSPADIREIGRFIRDELPTVQRWDLLAYTNLGRPKYRRLDLAYRLEEAELLSRRQIEGVWREAVALVPSARWSGATRAPDEWEG
jgi:pyruvate formate lyase activating enzyme